MYLNFTTPKLLQIPYKSYKVVVSLTHDNFETFGHWISEIFPELFLLPKKVKKEGYIICKKALSFHIEGYEIAGFSKDRILSGDNLTVFGSTVYTFSCQTCMHLNPPSIIFAKREISRVLKLDKLKPYRFVLFNRLDSRSLINFDQISNAIIKKYPNFNWVIQNYNTGSLVNQIKNWNSNKFVFGTHSSALFGCLFMQDNSIVAAIEWKLCYHSLQHLAVLSNLYFVHMREPKMTTKPYRIDLQNCIGLIECALKYGKVIK